MNGQTPKRINPAYNVALMASAGTGKTYNLALRVAAILMRDSHAHNLYDPAGGEISGTMKTYSLGKTLCLTFTRKATAEMQERVREYLTKISNGQYGEESHQYLTLAETLCITNPDEMRKRARKALERVYGDSGLLQIRTIDSFTSMILRLFPFEANLRPDFRIIDPEAEKSLRSQAFINAFENLRDPAAYNGVFAEYTAWTGEQPYKFTDRLNEQVEWIIERSVTLEEELEHAANFNIEHIAGLLKQARVTDRAITGRLKTLLAYISRPEMEGKLKAVPLRCIPAVSEIAAGEKRLSALFAGKKTLEYLSPAAIISEKNSGLLPEGYARTYAELIGHIKDHVRLYERLDLEIALHIAVYVHHMLDRLKQARGFVSYADLARVVYRMMNQDSYRVNKDYLYFRLDGRLEHILVDEFQDTSDVQWAILRPLAEEAMAGLAQSDKVGSFFCVGDSKQTIYRFRGSNPGFFQSIIKQYADRLVKEDLDVNHRSDRFIVDFVNTLFSDADGFIGGGEELKFEYAGQRAQSEKDGYVSVRHVVGEDAAEKGEARLEMLGSLMDDLIASGRDTGDIAILVSKQASGVAAHRYLKNIKKIDAHMGFAEFLINRPVFAAVEALVSYIHSGDPFSLATFLLTTPSVIPQSKVQPKNAFNRYKFILDSRLERSAGESVYRRIMALGQLLSLNRRFADDPDYKTLMGIIMQKLPSAANPLVFLSGLREAAAGTTAADTKTGGVKIMTIHGAKGLQFPTVILFDVNESFAINSKTKYFIDRPSGKAASMRRKLNKGYREFAPEDYIESIGREEALNRYEKMNQLYVAATRAKNALFIFVKNSKRNDTDSYILKHFPEPFGKGTLPEVSAPRRMQPEPPAGPDPFTVFCRNMLLKPLEYRDDPEKTKKAAAEALSKTPAPEAASQRAMKYIDNVLSPREYPKAESYGDEPYSSRFYGTFMHEIIYQMDALTPEAIPAALEKAWNRYGGYLESSALPRARTSAELLIKNEKWIELTEGAALFRERAVYHDRQLMVVDLYAVKDGKLTVIDFKTGGAEGKRHEEYAAQVKRYMRALSAQYGMRAEGYLIYMHGRDIQIFSL